MSTYTPVVFDFVQVERQFSYDGDRYEPDDPRIEFEGTCCDQCQCWIGGALDDYDDNGRPTAKWRDIFICKNTGVMLCEDCSDNWELSPYDYNIVECIRRWYPATQMLTHWEILRALDERFS